MGEFCEPKHNRRNMILENKLGITDQIELSKEEERLSKIGAKELFDSGKLDKLEPGTFEV